MNAKPGDKITIKIDGKEHETIIDEEGVQRFPKSPLAIYLMEEFKVDMNRLEAARQNGRIPSEELIQFYMGMGFSVRGLWDIPCAGDFNIENPLWE